MTRRWRWSAIRRVRGRPARRSGGTGASGRAAGVAGWGVLTVDPRGYVVHADERVRRLTGHRAGDLTGRHLSSLYPARSPTGTGD